MIKEHAMLFEPYKYNINTAVLMSAYPDQFIWISCGKIFNGNIDTQFILTTLNAASANSVAQFQGTHKDRNFVR